MAKIGKQVEGRFHGIPTLFIEVDEIAKLFNPENKHLLDKVGHVLISDYNSNIIQEDIEILMSLDSRTMITLETPTIIVPIEDIPTRFNIVLVIQHPQFFDLSLIDQIKFVTKDKMSFMVAKESMFFVTPDEFELENIEIK